MQRTKTLQLIAEHQCGEGVLMADVKGDLSFWPAREAADKTAARAKKDTDDDWVRRPSGGVPVAGCRWRRVPVRATISSFGPEFCWQRC